jgi:uncharacterized protein (TIGR04255 family)
MATRYENAPITEAIIELKIQEQGPATIEVLKGLEEDLKGTFPNKRKLFNVVGAFSAFETHVGSSAQQTLVGFQFISSDGKRFFDAKLDGVALHRLRPYSTWGDLRDEARRLWEVYRNRVGEPPICRVATRFINQIDIPGQRFDYKEYLLTLPEISQTLPQGLSSFFMQLQLPQEDSGVMVRLNEMTVPPPSPDASSIVLDIDVVAERQFGSDEAAWDLLEKLRDKKNEFFEGCITEKTRKLFGERSQY